LLIGAFISYAFDAFDFMLLAMALPMIINEWNLSMGKAGLLGTATLIGVGFSGIFWGWISDKYGRKKALMWSLFSFGIITGAISLTRSYEQLLILRSIGGVALGGIWGVLAAFLSETWPAHQRGRATAFVLSSWPVGYGMVAYVAAVILPRYGWRVLFATGFSSVLVTIYIYFFISESETWQKTIEKEKIAGKDLSLSAGLKEIFSGRLAKRTIFATLTVFFALTAYWGISTWLPTFLVKERGLDVEKMGLFMVMINVGMFLGYQVFGYLADKIGRKRTLIITFVGGSVMLPIYASVQNSMLLFWLGPLLMMFFVYAGVFGSYFPELYPTHVRTLGANFCGQIGRGMSAIGPYALGAFAATHGLAKSIGLCCFIFFSAAVMLLFLPENRKSNILLSTEGE
jgi:MFS family permease